LIEVRAIVRGLPVITRQQPLQHLDRMRVVVLVLFGYVTAAGIAHGNLLRVLGLPIDN